MNSIHVKLGRDRTLKHPYLANAIKGLLHNEESPDWPGKPYAVSVELIEGDGLEVEVRANLDWPDHALVTDEVVKQVRMLAEEEGDR